MKSARLTLLVSPDFKARLQRDAKRAEISVARLVRDKFDPGPSAEEHELRALAAELRRSTAETRAAVAAALKEIAAEHRTARGRRTTSATKAA
jgi:hypothetical protein